MVSKLTFIGSGVVALIAVAISACGAGSASVPSVLTALPASLSCLTDNYPTTFDKGELVFPDLAHDGVKSPGVVAMTGLTKVMFYGASTLDNEDRVLTLQGVTKSDGSTETLSDSFRLHPVSDEGNDHYKIDITTASEGSTKHFLCVGPVAQKQYTQQYRAQQTQEVQQAQVTPHIKAGGFICDKPLEALNEYMARQHGVQFVLPGCTQVGADTEVNVLATDTMTRTGALQVGNSGGTAWADPHDVVQ
jgi:hypothetical protein